MAFIALETFTLEGKVYHKGDKVENVSKRFVELGLVQPVAQASKAKLTEDVKPKKVEDVKEVLLTEDTSDVKVEVEEPKPSVKPLKKTKI